MTDLFLTNQFHKEVYMLCLRCQQDYIVKAKIKATEAFIFTCPECDATWFKIEEIGVAPFLDFATYMNSIGLAGVWEELEVIAERV
ncbi:hypothetical protein [Pseudomonas sp. MWU12-2115]|uniref:hypothetical protein n=1 Tax=unclassified Pseudomonas TaxID=196821 RepID=UPI001FFED176